LAEGASSEGVSLEGEVADGETADGEMGDTEAGALGEEGPSKSQVDFEAGRAEGVEEGRKVGFDEGMAKGTEEGRAAGRAEASAQLERAMQAFEAATAKLSDLTAIDSSALADSINNAIISLASERAGLAIASQPDGFADRIEALLATIRTVSGQPSIRLNPGDLASIQPLAETREKLRHCNFVADPALASGDLSVMVGTIGIDDIIVPDADATPAPDEPVTVANPAEETPAEETPAEGALAEAGEPTASAEAEDNADD
jgi:flagellar assembly protein FliH